MRAPLPLLLSLLFACAPEPADPGPGRGEADLGTAADGAVGGGSADADAPGDARVPLARGLPVRHIADEAAAARGEAWFTQSALGGGLIPAAALRHIYVAWPLGDLQKLAYFNDAERFWADFGARYGLHPAPFDNGPYPLGLRDAGNGLLSLDCMACHAGVVNDQVVIGLGNAAFDLQGLYDDLWRLPAELEALQARDLPAPYDRLVDSFPVPEDVAPIPELDERTAAAGHTDAFGLGLTLSARLRPVDGIHTDFGPQDPAPWWTLKFKDRAYVDGMGPVGGHRTMMATLLAFGLSTQTYLAMDSEFVDIEQYLWSVTAPARADWGPAAPDAAAVATGQALFATHCADCHGTYEGPEAGFPDRVVEPATVGTDPMRAERFGEAEAAHVNAIVVEARHRVEATGGYLAPVLTGVWASAPYLHNGSVPTLWAVLTPDARPTLWRAEGGAYDLEGDVGLAHTVVDAVPDGDAVLARRVIDTTAPGLGNAGHTYGAGLSEPERRALLAYLTTL